MEDKKKYIDAYNRMWDKYYAEAVSMDDCDDPSTYATECFEENAGVDEVVGYYIVYHGDYALKDWLDNTNGISKTEQDLNVERILKKLYGKETSE